MGNIIGLDLNIDQDYLAEAVRQTVVMGISEALNGKNEIVSQIVKMVLNTKVDRTGKISSYQSDNKYSLLEFYVKEMLTDVAREEMMKMVNEHRDEIAILIRNELQKKVNYTKFVDRFIETTSNAISSTWCPKIEISFDKLES